MRRPGRAVLLLAAGATAALVIGALAVLRPIPTTSEVVALDAPRFVDEATGAGIVHAYAGDFTFFVGGGVAAFDCNDDGHQDLFFAGGADSAALYRNDSPVGGALRFTRLSDPVTDLPAVTGAYPLDIDGDGETDLAVLRLGENVLLRGRGGCRFERANERWGFDGGDSWSAAFSATWEDGAALPTLAVGNYLKLNPDGSSTFDCQDGELFRPLADGGSYGAPIPLSPGYCPLSMLFSDWSRSGQRDLRVSNDRHYYGEIGGGQEQLWRVAPGDAPSLYTQDQGWQPVKIWGMGIASFDLTGDGYPELYLTSQADNKLQTLADGPAAPDYTDIALRRGVTAHRPYEGDTSLASTAWHPEFADLNNDGLVDLLVTKGNVDAQEGFALRDPNDLFIGQLDGTFSEEAEQAGIMNFSKARGAAIVDLNLDGLLDMVIVNRVENVELWRNVGAGTAATPEPMGNWIALRLEDPGANRDAIGSWLEVSAGGRESSRELTVGGGHVSGELGWVHFGIGSADEATVNVTWPDGQVSEPITVRANGFALIRRGATAAVPWTPQ